MSASNRAQVEVSEKEIAAAENKTTVQKAEVELTEAKRRLVKAETELDAVKDVLREAQEADPVDDQRVAKAELGVAEAKLGVAEAKLGVAEAKLDVAEAKWQAAPEDEKAVFLASVKTAQESVKTAQESVNTAQEIAKTANIAYNNALSAPTATPQQGGFLSPEQVLKDFFEELRTRDERQHREQLQLLRHLTQPQNPWAEMARTSAASDTSSQQRFRTKLADFYSRESSGDRKRKVKCAVTGMEDAPEEVRVVAAHIWPKSAAATFPLELTDGVNHPSNGIFFHKCIEEVFDQLRVCLVCNPFKISATFVVLDEDVAKKNLKGTNRTFRQLHGQQLEFEKDKRPSFQLLSRHAQQAFSYSGNKHWMSEEDLSSFKSVLQVGSPQK